MTTPLFREVGLPANNINNLSYAGPLLGITPIIGADRAPTSNNYRFPVNTFWNNTDDLAVSPDAKGDLWYMSKKSQYQATWVKLSGGGTGPLLQFTPSSGSVVYPNATTGNVNMTAGAGITITGTADVDICFDRWWNCLRSNCGSSGDSAGRNTCKPRWNRASYL